MATTKKSNNYRSVTTVCSLTEIQNRATSIRLFDGTTWINLSDGRIINIKTLKLDSLVSKYDEIRTATIPGKVVFAKRFKPQDLLCFVEHPYKIRSQRK